MAQNYSHVPDRDKFAEIYRPEIRTSLTMKSTGPYCVTLFNFGKYNNSKSEHFVRFLQSFYSFFSFRNTLIS